MRGEAWAGVVILALCVWCLGVPIALAIRLGMHERRIRRARRAARAGEHVMSSLSGSHVNMRTGVSTRDPWVDLRKRD